MDTEQFAKQILKGVTLRGHFRLRYTGRQKF